ncbi:MAG: 5-formyltetrahydrofolate cyclo-ligase [Actinomycetota bacterium]|nr:5-formyltetrahydrofolate cyclo-ligase [Actinomycetota bacterium]
MRDSPGPSASKASWRRWARKARATLELAPLSEELVDRLAAWPPLRQARLVLGYLPLPGEPDLTPLPDLLPGHSFAVTRTPLQGPLTVHPLTSPMERHRLGFWQPVAQAPAIAPEDVDVALVPGLAFDRCGVRLGQGEGHFDRFLPALPPQALLVGVAPAALVVAELPRQPHDVRMTHLATERGIRAVEALSS